LCPLPYSSGLCKHAATLPEIKKNIKEAIDFHVESCHEDGDSVPDVFIGEYELEYKLSIEALLNAYSDVFTKAALSQITGINQRQLWHYASGMRKPRPTQRKRIEEGLHRLGKELLNIGV